MEASPPLRIGILGAARIAVEALIDPAAGGAPVAIAAVAARDRDIASRFAHAHGIPRVHRDYAALIADPSIEAVYVALPNSLHAEWTLRAVGAGKHVLCEKPMASNAHEAEAVAAAARGSGLVVAEAFHYRHHPLARRLEAYVGGGALGPIEYIEGTMDVSIRRDDQVRWSWELAGGATMDLGCYPLQMIRWLGGGMPEVVSAEAVVGPPRVDASMVARLLLPGGGGAVMRCAMDRDAIPQSSLLVRGSRGEMRVENPVAPHLGNRLLVTCDGVTREERVPGGTTYAYQLHDFVAAVRARVPMPVDAGAAVLNMRLIDRVYEAAGLPRRGQPAPAGGA